MPVGRFIAKPVDTEAARVEESSVDDERTVSENNNSIASEEFDLNFHHIFTKKSIPTISLFFILSKGIFTEDIILSYFRVFVPSITFRNEWSLSRSVRMSLGMRPYGI